MIKKGFKHCLYDPFNKQILLKEIGETEFRKIPYEFDYYIEDTNSKNDSGFKDIHGKVLKHCFTDDKRKLDSFRNSGISICESDISEAVKFIHDTYDDFQFDATAKDYRICWYDIETQTSCRQDRTVPIKVQLKSTGEYLEKCLNDIDDVVHTDDYLYYDAEKNKYVPFKDSCYFISEFPNPEEANYPINLLGCYSNVTKQLYIWGLRPFSGNKELVPNYRQFKNDYDLLVDFVKWFAKQKFDIFTGWNSDRFDLHYIINRVKKLEEERGIDNTILKYLSPLHREPKVRPKVDKKGQEIGKTINIPGLYTPDYMDVCKNYVGLKLTSYSLDNVGHAVLGKGKLEYEGQIYEIYKTNFNRYTEYNAVDVMTMVEIEEAKHPFDVMCSYAADCLITLDKTNSMIAAVEGYILKFMHKRGLRLNDKVKTDIDWWHDEQLYIVKNKDGNYDYQNCYYEEKQEKDFEKFFVKAGYCYACPGRYKWVISGDIQSSYPHQIMMYNISPEIKVVKPTKEQIDSGEVIQSEVNGVGFKRTDHALLPDVIRNVFAERLHFKTLMKEARKAHNDDDESYYDKMQAIKKRIINSAYGVCLNDNFHLFDIDCARAITRGGRDTIRFLRDCTNQYYLSQQCKRDTLKYFPYLQVTISGKDSYYMANEDITILRGSSNITIKAKEYQDGDKIVTEGIALEPSKVIRYDNTKFCDIIINNREGAVVQMDTDSCYCCFEEMKEKWYKDMDGFVWFDALEKMLNEMWAKVLDIRAKKKKIPQMIKFVRENMFYGFFSFAKKCYIGSIVDNEGERYSFEEPHNKIKGVILQKTEMPEFCKQEATKLAFDIVHGLTYDEASDVICKIYQNFKNQPVDKISSKRTISDYAKYVKHDIQWYVDNGLYFDKGMPMSVKMGLAYNYVCAKNKLVLKPIDRNEIFNYIFLTNNKYNLENIGYIGSWPKEFEQIFKIDYETSFKKFFLAIFESMFEILNWKNVGDNIKVTKTVKINKFIKRG